MARRKEAEEAEVIVEAPACDHCTCETCPGRDADISELAEHSKVCTQKHF